MTTPIQQQMYGSRVDDRHKRGGRPRGKPDSYQRTRREPAYIPDSPVAFTRPPAKYDNASYLDIYQKHQIP